MENLYGTTANSYIVIDLQKLRRNVLKITAVLGNGVKFLPVLKGNACGHGLAEVGAFLVRECGIDMLCVGPSTEAECLRSFGLTCDILTLGGTPFNNIPYVVAHDITTTLAGAEYAELLSHEAVSQHKTAKVHLKIDTGLGRMGVRCGEELDSLLRTVTALPGIEIEGAYTHFADSSAIDTSFIDEQAAAFDAALEQIKAFGVRLKYCHAANTPAIVRFPQYHYNMVRSLLLLVGRDWSVDQKNRLGLEESLYWRSFICQINHFKAGERFGYNRSFTAEQDMTVAIASFGYSDGYPDDMVRHGASVILKGKRARILSMNMDQCFIDITGIENVRINDQVLIIGRDGEEELTVDEVLQDTPHVGTYVLSTISPRVRRIIKY